MRECVGGVIVVCYGCCVICVPYTIAEAMADSGKVHAALNNLVIVRCFLAGYRLQKWPI